MHYIHIRNRAEILSAKAGIWIKELLVDARLKVLSPGQGSYRSKVKK
jgi:hypothetical protein